MNEIKMRNRESHRLTGYDYSRNGAYYITIVCQDRMKQFGHILNGKMVLNDAGRMVRDVWNNLPNRFPTVVLDSFMIMPNHIHGIIVINDVGTPLVDVGDSTADDDSNNGQAQCKFLHGLGDIVGAFKSISTNRYINGVKMKLVPPFRKRLWQQRYYDIIIRNENMYHEIRQYIINNPQSL